jgi:cell division protein FtsA
MAHEQLITALDIGSSSVKIGSAVVDPKSSMLRLVGASNLVTLGVRRGQIVDIAEVIKSTREAFDDTERVAGLSISRAVAIVGGAQTDLVRSVGSIAVSRADGEVSPEDIERVLESARTVSLPQNKEVIHTIPLSFTLDGEGNIEDPLGMKGVRLEAHVVLVLASTPFLRTLKKVVHEAGREAEAWVYGPLAASRAVLSKRQREVGVALCDIGASTTTTTFFYEGELRESSTIFVGGGNITHDIAIGLKTTLDVAEKVKMQYGTCASSSVSKRERVVLTEWGLEDISVSRYALSRIVEGRAKELFDALGSDIADHVQDRKLPGGVVLVGGGAKLDGIVECAKQTLKLPAERGKQREIEGDLPELTDPTFASVVGALVMTWEEEQKKESVLPGVIDTYGFASRVKEWLKEFLP